MYTYNEWERDPIQTSWSVEDQPTLRLPIIVRHFNVNWFMFIQTIRNNRFEIDYSIPPHLMNFVLCNLRGVICLCVCTAWNFLRLCVFYFLLDFSSNKKWFVSRQHKRVGVQFEKEIIEKQTIGQINLMLLCTYCCCGVSQSVS
jgi:hypothetical protein